MSTKNTTEASIETNAESIPEKPIEAKDWICPHCGNTPNWPWYKCQKCGYKDSRYYDYRWSMTEQLNQCVVCGRKDTEFVDVHYSFVLHIDRICEECYHWMDDLMLELGFKQYNPVGHATFLEYFDMGVIRHKKIKEAIEEELKNMTLEKAKYMQAHHGFDLWGHLSGYTGDPNDI